MAQVEYHRIKLTVQILKTYLSVKFPCSLRYQLKCQGSVSQSTGSYQLKDGKSESHQRLTIDFEAKVIKQKYSNVKAILAVIMISANGKVPAGSISIPISDNGKLASKQREETKSIQKCPDKLAKVIYRINIQQVGSHRKTLSSNLLTQSASRFNTLTRNYIFQSTQQKDLMPVTKKYGIFTSRSKNKTVNFNERQNRDSGVNQQSFQKQVLVSVRSNSMSQNSIIDNQKIQQFGNHRPEATYNNQKQDLGNLLQKTISQAGLDFKYFTHFTQQQLSKYKLDMHQLMIEINSLREKNRNYQRRERQHNQQIREQREQIEKLRNKSNINQTSNFEFKLINQEKQRQILKQSQQIRNLKQHIEQIKSSSNIHEKRTDYKEIMLNEQIKKLNQKYQQSEQERQKMLIQMNNMLTQFQNSQKKNQLNYKQKQKLASQERNRLNKKIQNLASSLETLQQKNTQLKSEVLQLNTRNQQLNMLKIEIQGELQQIKAKCQKIEQKQKKSYQKNRQLEDQIIQIKQQRQKLSIICKKYGQLQLEYHKLKEQQIRSSKKIQILNKNIKQIQQNVKQTNNSKQQLVLRNAQLTKQIINLRKTLEDKQFQLFTAHQTNNTLLSKSHDYKSKYDNDRSLFDELKTKLQNQIAYLTKVKDSNQNQLQNVKWKLQKSQQTIEVLRNRINQLNQRILKSNQEVLNQQQKKKTFNEAYKQLQNNLQILQADLRARQQKQKELLDVIKVKNQIEHSNIKKKRQLQQQIAILKQKQSHLNLSLDDTKKNLQVVTRQKQLLHIKYNNQRQQLLNELKFTQNGRQLAERQIQRMKVQLIYYKQGKSQVQGKISSLQTDLLDKIKVIRQIGDQITSRIQSQQRLNSLVKKKDFEIRQNKEVFQKFKTDMAFSIEKFVHQFYKQTSNQDNLKSPRRQKNIRIVEQNSLLQFPDDNIANLLSKLFKKRSQLTTRYNQHVYQLSQNLKSVSIQLKKAKQALILIEKQYQKCIQQQKNKNKQLIEKTMNQKNELLQKISQTEQKIIQIQSEKLKKIMQMDNLKQQLEQIRSLNNHKINQNKQLQKKIGSLQKQKVQQQRMIEHLKKNANGQLIILNEQNKNTIQRQKNNVRQLQKKLIRHENQATQRERIVKDLQNSLVQKSYEMQKLMKKLELITVTEQNHKQTIKNIRIQLTESNKKIEDLNNQKENISGELKNENLRNEHNQLKITKLSERVQQLDISRQSLQNQVGKLQTQIKEYQTTIQKLGLQLRSVKQSNSFMIKQLQQRIISLNSQIELKQFLYKQIQNHYNQSKSQHLSNIEQIIKRKQQNHKLNQIIQNFKNQRMALMQSNQNLLNQKKILQDQHKKHRQRLQLLTNQSLQRNFIDNLIEVQQKQNQKLKNELINMYCKHQALQKQLKTLTGQRRKQVVMRNGKQQELKRRVRDLQKQLSNKTYEFEVRTHRRSQIFGKQKNQYERKIQFLQQEIQRLKNSFEGFRQQSRRQLQSLNRQCAQLTGLITQKEELLCSKNQKITQYQNRVKLLTMQLKQCFSTWDTQKKDQKQVKEQRFNKIGSQIDIRSKNLFGNLNKSTKTLK